MRLRRCLRDFGRYLGVFGLLGGTIFSGALATQTVRAEKPRPFPKQEIIRLLKGDVTPKRVAELARERGIDFQITPEVERDLRTAGADDALISALRAAAPTPVAPAAPNPPAERQPSGAPAPGTVRTNPKDALKYGWISPGTFMMGCSPGDNDCTTAEKPSHQVSITKGFWLGQTPVTVLAYRRFAGATGRAMPAAPTFNTDWNTQEMPIVNVSWEDAQAYCAWAGERLPTEAEWEYAARAGSTGERYGPLDEIAWYSGNSRGRTHRVAQKRPNAFGLYDMLGNVWQWVNDWYGENYYPASPSRDPEGPASGQYRVLRGGSWLNLPRYARVSDRVGFPPADRLVGLGFRCAREVNSRFSFFLDVFLFGGSGAVPRAIFLGEVMAGQERRETAVVPLPSAP